MHPIEQRIHDDNLRTAWALAGDWPAAHQDQLADLVVERFLRQPKQTVCTAPCSSNSTYAGPGCGEACLCVGYSSFPQICLRLATGVQS